MKDVFRIIKSTGLYFLGNVLSKLILFILLPIYTHYLLPEDLGYYDVANTFLNLIITFLFLDIYVGVMRFIYDEKENSLYNPITNGFIVFLGSLLLYTLFSILIYVFFDVKYIEYIYLYGVCLVFNNMFGYIARALKHSTLFAITGVVGTIVTCVVSILGLVVLGKGVEVLYVAAILGLTIQILIIEFRVKIISNLSLSLIDRTMLRSLCRYSFPLSLNSLSYWLLTGYTSVVIAQMLGLVSNGYYLIAMKFGLIVTLFASCFNLAWQELAFEKGNENENELGMFYSTAINMLIALLTVGSVLIIGASYIIFPVMVSAAYSESFFIIPNYLIVAVLSVLSGFLGQIYGALKKTKMLTYSTLLACLVNVVLVPFFIFLFGLQGAVIAMLVSYLINVILRIYFVQRSVKIRLDFKQLLFSAFLIAISFYTYYTFGIIPNIILPVVVVLFFALRHKSLLMQVAKQVFEK